MSFLDKVKSEKQKSLNSREEHFANLRQQEKDKIVNRIIKKINNIESVKEEIIISASKGCNSHKVLVGAAIIGGANTISGYQSVKQDLIFTRKIKPEGFGGFCCKDGWVYSINEECGKECILDKDLLVLWNMLEELGLKPFFSGYAPFSVDLQVHI